MVTLKIEAKRVIRSKKKRDFANKKTRGNPDGSENEKQMWV